MCSSLPTLVAHRGDARHCPENTIPALQSALEAGAEWIEFDVQLSADGVPVLLHDDDLRRTAGRSGRVHEFTRAQLDAFDVGEAARFGDRFTGTRLPSLAEAIDLVRAWPDRRAFVEVKRSCLRTFGRSRVLECVMPLVASAPQQCVLISFDHAVVERARAIRHVATGWVLEAWDDRTRAQAETLAPEFLFVNIRRLPPAPTPLWSGPWRWVVYEIQTLDEARAFAARGAALAESMAIVDLLRARAAGDDRP